MDGFPGSPGSDVRCWHAALVPAVSDVNRGSGAGGRLCVAFCRSLVFVSVLLFDRAGCAFECLSALCFGLSSVPGLASPSMSE